MKRVVIYSPSGISYTVDCEDKDEFNNLFRDDWIGDGTPWEELPEADK